MSDRAPTPFNRVAMVAFGLAMVGLVAWSYIPEMSPRERTSAWPLFGALAIIGLILGAVATRWRAYRRMDVKLTLGTALAFGGLSVIVGTQEPLIKTGIVGAVAGWLFGSAIFWPRSQ